MRSDDRFALPGAEVEKDQRIAEVLTAAMKNTWNVDAACLFCPEVSSPPHGNVRYQVMECWQPPQDRGDGRTAWIPVSQLSHSSFEHSVDRTAVRRSLAQYKAYANGAAPGPFAKPGWTSELRVWLNQVIGPMKLRLTGRVAQLNASPSYSLLRFETDGPAIWFKAVGEPNAQEFHITMALSQLFPEYLPQVLAARTKWNGWLAAEVGGTSLERAGNAEAWITAAQHLAKLQIASMGESARLPGRGAQDLRTSVLECVLPGLLEGMAAAMAMQQKSPPPALTREDVLLLAHPIEDALLNYTTLGIPDCLGHLDLNPSNIVVGAQGCKFLDWAEAYVGNPFLSLEYLLQHFHRSPSATRAAENQLREAYLERWRPLLSPVLISEALATAPLLAVLAYASSSEVWRNPDATHNAAAAGYFRGLTRRLHRETEQLIRRRTRC